MKKLLRKWRALKRLAASKNWVLITLNYYDINITPEDAKKFAKVLYQSEDIFDCESAINITKEIISKPHN